MADEPIKGILYLLYHVFVYKSIIQLDSFIDSISLLSSHLFMHILLFILFLLFMSGSSWVMDPMCKKAVESKLNSTYTQKWCEAISTRG